MANTQRITDHSVLIPNWDMYYYTPHPKDQGSMWKTGQKDYYSQRL